jgi:hypothetical protein
MPRSVSSLFDHSWNKLLTALNIEVCRLNKQHCQLSFFRRGDQEFHKIVSKTIPNSFYLTSLLKLISTLNFKKYILNKFKCLPIFLCIRLKKNYKLIS